MQMSEYAGLSAEELAKASYEAAPVDPKVVAERDAALEAVNQHLKQLCDARAQADLARQGVKRFKAALEGYERAMEASIAEHEKKAQENVREAQKAHDAANAKLGRLAAEAADAALAKAHAAREAQ
jgi:hypothetical protein